jgi:hypothetical protein
LYIGIPAILVFGDALERCGGNAAASSTHRTNPMRLPFWLVSTNPAA